LALLFLVALAACTTAPPQPAGLRLAKIGFAQLPQWSIANADAALESFQQAAWC
jgi:hypothetical protein